MDLILKDIFKNKKNGFYVDVGCQHPIKNNNTYLLFKNKWSGINIDMDRLNIDFFNYNRPNDININAAVSDRRENVDFFYYHDKSPINTLNQNISDKHMTTVKQVFKIQTETISKLLENLEIPKIDLLTIDVEGHELKVLKGFDFDKYNPSVIVLEFLDLEAEKWEIPYNNFNNILNSEIFIFLQSKNYKFVNWVNGDLVFVVKNFKN